MVQIDRPLLVKLSVVSRTPENALEELFQGYSEKDFQNLVKKIFICSLQNECLGCCQLPYCEQTEKHAGFMVEDFKAIAQLFSPVLASIYSFRCDLCSAGCQLSQSS